MQSSTGQHGQVLQVGPTFVPHYSRVPVDLLGNGFRHFTLPTGQYVTVNVHRGAGLGVTNPFRDHDWVFARLQRHHCVKMPQAPGRQVRTLCLFT